MILELSLTYVIVFITTLLPAGWFVLKTIKSARKVGWLKVRTIGLFVVAFLFWFSPSLVTFGMAVANDAPLWFKTLILLLISIGVIKFAKKFFRSKDVTPLIVQVKERVFVSLLIVAEKFLRVQFLSSDDDKAIALITRFRGEYVTWAESTSGVPREIDVYDTQPTTIHVAVFLRLPRKDWLVGYGRLLFGCNQMLDKYVHVLNGSDVQEQIGVEVSRLLVVPHFHGYPVRGTKWSAIIQLLIYRRFFQACETYGATEWWAVLGKGLHRLLCGFGFPFERVNSLEGKDAAGTYYAVKMQIGEGRDSLQSKSPFLYRWFCAVEKTPVGFTRMNGRQDVPIKVKLELESTG